jgi:hypothetical protein
MPKPKKSEITRIDKYTIQINGGPTIRATDDQMSRILALNAEQLERFSKIMGGGERG